LSLNIHLCLLKICHIAKYWVNWWPAWSHFFFTNKVCKKVGYQNTLSSMNRRFVINYIAQWKILDLLYIIFFFSFVAWCHFFFILDGATLNWYSGTTTSRSCSLLDFYAPLLSEIYWFIFFSFTERSHWQEQKVDQRPTRNVSWPHFRQL
jgi:hypothetical protein